MTRRSASIDRPPSWLFVLWPVLLLLADRGQLNADTKYDLTGDPMRLIRAATSSWDEALHGGWVIQQHAGYLWPTGPFFAITNALPDWVQQRLWLVVLLIVAGLGARWSARMLGLGAGAATVAGLVYQVSPYTVPYLARTSAMLLPWVVAGWVLGAAVCATLRPSPRWVAVLAFALATAGGVNSTAILMITPLPILWFWWARRLGDITTRRAVGLSIATGAATAVASAWWLTSAWIGARQGPDLLSFSETLRDVSSTATGPEALRLSGYWLTYVVEGNGLATTEVGRMLTGSALVVAATMLMSVAGLVGACAGRWAHRGFMALVMLVAVVLAVGVYPIDDASPLSQLALSGLSDGALTAVRSSTRALPMLGLVLAIGVGRLVSRLRPQPVIVAAGFAVLAIAAPWFSLGRIVDPALSRPANPPGSWNDALDALDAAERVLVVPGSEFSTFTWGHTQDPPWTSTAAVITRELLPLGSPDRMDLLLAVDDAIQEGRLVPNSMATVAQLLGADHVWVAGDVDHARYRTAPLAVDVLDGAEGLETVEVVDGVVGLYEVNTDDLGPTGGEVAVFGGGRGALAAIDAGLIRPGMTVWRADTAPDEVPVIVTDGDRDAVRQWRTSQGTLGATSEPTDLQRDGVAELTVPDSIRTVARFGDGSYTVSVSTYGDPFEFQPEYRAAMALDGDPDTAWRVADPARAPSLSIEGYVTQLAPVAVAEVGGITRLKVESVSREGAVTTMLEADAGGRFATLELPAETYSLTVTIDDVLPGTSHAGLAELVPSSMVDDLNEWLVVPTVHRGDALVLQRWHLNRTIAGRSDPEPLLRRVVPLTADVQFDVHVTGVGSAGTECRTGVLQLDGVDVPIDPVSGGTCDGVPLIMRAGDRRIESTADLVVFAPHDATANEASSAQCCTIVVPHAAAAGWSVQRDGVSLEPVSLIGGAMAVRAADGVTIDDLTIRWQPDRWYRWSMMVSGVAAVAIALVVLIDPGAAPRRRRRNQATIHGVQARALRAVAAGAMVALTVDPLAGVAVTIAAFAVPRGEWLALTVIAGGAGLVVIEVLIDHPAHGIAWPQHFGVLHLPVTAAMVGLATWLAIAPIDD